MEKQMFDKWDIPGVAGTVMSIIALFRGQAPTAVPHGTDGEATQKMISSIKAAFSKEDEGIWVSLMVSLNAPQQRAITLVLGQLTGVDEVDSFRLAVVNAPNVTTVEETRDPAKPKIVTKKVTKVAEFEEGDNRVKFLKAIAALSTSDAVTFLRTHKIATENVVTKYGPALIDQLTALIPDREVEEEGQGWQGILERLKRVPIAIWIMGGGTVIGFIAIAIKTHFFD